MIDTQKDLEELISRARKTDAVALDTEFVWERTYYPRLGLIQLALSDEDCHLIDPCALSDLSPLGDLLADREVIKIFHDAPQDLTILSQATGSIPKNIFDTRLAAGFAGLPSTISLCNLLHKLLDIDLPKTETRTNWLQRPLKAKQEEYALDDVRYLRAARVLLLGHVINEKVKSCLLEELKLLDEPISYQPISDNTRYLKIKGNGNLSRQSLAILQELSLWREKEARSRNLPRGHIINDRVLLPIARKKLLTKEEILASGPISEKAVKRYGKVLIQKVKSGLNRPQDTWPPSTRQKKLSPKAKQLLQDLHEFITLKSDILGIDPILVANNSELKQLISTPAEKRKIENLRQLQGWRSTFLQEIFEEPSWISADNS